MWKDWTAIPWQLPGKTWCSATAMCLDVGLLLIRLIAARVDCMWPKTSLHSSHVKTRSLLLFAILYPFFRTTTISDSGCRFSPTQRMLLSTAESFMMSVVTGTRSTAVNIHTMSIRIIQILQLLQIHIMIHPCTISLAVSSFRWYYLPNADKLLHSECWAEKALSVHPTSTHRYISNSYFP